MQEDSLEEFWWDEFVALTVEESEERKSAYSRSRQFLYRDLVRNIPTYHQKEDFGNSVGLVKDKVNEACLRSANVTKPENKHFLWY